MSADKGSSSFISRYVFSLDHRVIGLQYLLSAMAMALVGTPRLSDIDRSLVRPA